MPGLLLPLLALFDSLHIRTDNPRLEWPNGVVGYGDDTDDGTIFTVPSATQQGVRHTVMKDPAADSPNGWTRIEDFLCDCSDYRRQDKVCDHVWEVVLRGWEPFPRILAQ